jgi:pentose-5-phosphate-3-epimerase
MLGQIIEVDVLPKGTGQQLMRVRYRVTEVRQHISTWADISDVPDGRVILQTSETDHHDGTKMVVIGKYIDTTTSTRPVPVAKPQICE